MTRVAADPGLVLAVDIGTTATKAGVVDRKGRVLAWTQRPNPILRPESGAAEHDPERLYRTFIECARKVVRGRASQVKSVVLTGYQLGLVALDDRFRPLMPMMTLLDTRPQRTFPELVRRCDARGLYRRTGCPPFAAYPLAKLFWLRRNRPTVFRRARWFVGSKDWIAYRLTGRMVTEPSLSSACWMMDIRKRAWDPHALRVAGVSADRMPPFVSPYSVMGSLAPAVARSLGLVPAVKVIPGIYDAPALMIGLDALAPGVAAVNLGTTAMVRMQSTQPVLDRDMGLQAYALDLETYLAGSGVNNAGNGRDWIRRRFGIADVATLDKMAAAVPPGSGGLLFLPYFTGERDPRIGSGPAALVGLRDEHGPGHFARAHLEGVAYTIRMIIGKMARNGVRIRAIRTGGGGARSAIWVQIVADVTGLPVTASAEPHASLLGCAAIGYTTAGSFPSLRAAARALARPGRVFRPSPAAARAYRDGYAAYQRAIDRVYGTGAVGA